MKILSKRSVRDLEDELALLLRGIHIIRHAGAGETEREWEVFADHLTRILTMLTCELGISVDRVISRARRMEHGEQEPCEPGRE